MINTNKTVIYIITGMSQKHQRSPENYRHHTYILLLK